MNEKERIAETLKALREEAGLTQRSLAQATGISLSAIIAYENKQREPNSKNMAILERFFHVSGAYLRGEAISKNVQEPDVSLELLPLTLQRIAQSTQTNTVQNQAYVIQILSYLNDILNIEDDNKRSFLLETIAQCAEVIKTSTDRYHHS